jgi:phage-related protein
MKPVRFIGSAREDLSAFPQSAKSHIGHELFLVQEGFEPTSWKPMKVVGMGAREIRMNQPLGAFRVVYVAAFASAIYVLHAFQKKTRTTSHKDIELARRRYRQVAVMERLHRHG